MKFSITFLGSAGTVTGSRFLLDVDTSRLLIDCGLFQGVKELRSQNWSPFPIDPRSIDAVLLTHAHLDHTGYLPLLVRGGFKGKVYCTLPTKQLTEILLRDAARIQEEEAEHANEIGSTRHSPARPLFTLEDARKALDFLEPSLLDKWTPLPGKTKFRFRMNGHILGSAFIELEASGRRLLFSGDLGRQKPVLLRPPSAIDRADYLILESTYGDRRHPIEAPIRALERIINETLDRGGNVLIPSFAVGRAQDLLYLLGQLREEKRIPSIPLWLDSPMAAETTRLVPGFPEWYRLSEKAAIRLSQSAHIVSTQRESQGLARSKKQRIVIAGAGMVTGGRILWHLQQGLSKKENTVLLVGFQAAGTRGSQLRDGTPEVKIFGEYIPVKAHIAEISGLSAHADQKETLHWLRGFKKPPRKTFLVHGEPQAADSLRVRINDSLGWECHVAKYLESVDL